MIHKYLLTCFTKYCRRVGGVAQWWSTLIQFSALNKTKVKIRHPGKYKSVLKPAIAYEDFKIFSRLMLSVRSCRENSLPGCA